MCARIQATQARWEARALGRYIFVPASFYPDAASELRDTAGFIGRIIGKAATRAKDPVAYKVEFEDGPDELYVTPPDWGGAAKALSSEGVKMLS